MKSFFAKAYFLGALAAGRGVIRRVEPIQSLRSEPGSIVEDGQMPAQQSSKMCLLPADYNRLA
jgi:hypothetical protein